MKILVKYPTRQRPELFLKTLKGYIDKMSGSNEIIFLVSYDEDDKTMTHQVFYEAYEICSNITMVRGVSDSKIHACNRDINKIAFLWDIVLLISDDMECQVQNWDQVIRDKMTQFYPDTNGCLWFHDGSDQKRISTLSCIGRVYYNKFGYLYYPEYKSFFCDNEYTEVATKTNQIRFIDEVIIKHRHPAWEKDIPNDALYVRNNKHWKHDQDLYRKRKSLNFPV